MDRKPRAHHMMVKYQLVRMALQDPGRFFTTFGDGGDRQYLWKLWQAMGHKHPTEERISADGLIATQASGRSGQEIMMINFPPIASENEAYYLALMRSDGMHRVFCLEAATDPCSGNVLTFVTEFVTHGRVNWGEGCEPTVIAFQEKIVNLYNNEDARPLSFFPIPLA